MKLEEATVTSSGLLSAALLLSEHLEWRQRLVKKKQKRDNLVKTALGGKWRRKGDVMNSWYLLFSWIG